MPSFNLPPEEQREVKPFDPLVLDRTVIAVPLLKEMQEDLDLTGKIEIPSGIQRSDRIQRRFFRRRERRAGASSQDGGSRQGQSARQLQKSELRRADKETVPEARKRDAALLEAIDKLTIGPLRPTGHSFAFLHAAIIWRLLAENERFASAGSPIERIYPKRFEIIIDLNLEHPGGRESARQWVIENIEKAKQLADVHDAGQEIHFEKDRPNSQYVFARLGGRAIQALVVLDMQAAKAEKIALRERPPQMTPRRRPLKRKTRPRARPESRGDCKYGYRMQVDPAKFRAIFHIWPDFEVSACIQQIHRDRQSRRRAELLLGVGRWDHLGSHGFRDPA